MTGRNIHDILGGAIAVVLGLGFLIKAFDYGIGTGTAMEAGFFPMMISSLVVLIGAVTALKGFYSAGYQEPVYWRPFLAVCFAVVAFGLTIQVFGLLPAVAVCAVVAAFGDSQSRPVVTLIAAGVICLGIWLIFSLGLGLPIPVVQGVF